MMGNASPRTLSRDDKPNRHPQRVRGKALLALAFLAAFGTAPVARADETLTDSVGHEAKVPAKVEAVVPAGAPAQVLLHALAPSKLAGLVEPFKPEHAIYVDKTIADLPQIPVLSRANKPGDIAMVAALKPGLVVDYGNASKSYAAADAKIEKELGVPTVLYGGALTDAPHVARAIGAALGDAKRGEAVAATIEKVLAQVKPLGELPDAQRVTVYLARGTDGLSAARAGTSFDEPIRLAGGRNVVEGGNGTFKKMSVAEVVALKPAVVVFGERDALSSPLKAALPKETKFVLDTGEPYKALTGPPSLNRLAGLAALAMILHSKEIKMDPEDVTRIETALFPIPPGLALPSPLQVQP